MFVQFLGTARTISISKSSEALLLEATNPVLYGSRCVKKVRNEGDKGLAHKSRGKPSNRKLPKKIKDRVIELYRGKLKGFGPTLASEKLSEMEGIQISDETLRLWLTETGGWERARKVRAHRQWRERKHYLGEMIQIDGSHHDWFEGRGLKCVLMGYIDDATGRVYGKFYKYEGTIPAMDSFKRYIRKYGIPSPQAKGRIERLFGTFQDRVVKEMRLRGISTIEEANKFLQGYLPEYNRRFTVKPKENIRTSRNP